MENYIKTLQRASGAVYTIFRKASLQGISPDLAFKELQEQYKGSDAAEYVESYIGLCRDELPNIKEPTAYFAEAQKATAETWNVFKAHVKKLYEEYLGRPGGHKSHKTLHTSYVKRSIN